MSRIFHERYDLENPSLRLASHTCFNLKLEHLVKEKGNKKKARVTWRELYYPEGRCAVFNGCVGLKIEPKDLLRYYLTNYKVNCATFDSQP